MKITRILVTVLLATAAFSLSVHAQIFSASMSATKDSNVFAGAGGTALAWDFSDYNASTTTVVNGVTFSGDQDNAVTGVDFSLVITGASHDQNGVNDMALATTGGSANYAYILQHLAYGGTPASLTFTGLKAGDSYELQVFAGGGASAPETLTDSSTIPGPSPASPSGTLDYGSAYNTAVAAYINESFTAPVGGTETINLSGDGYMIVSAVNLQVIPEPSAYALMLGGLGCLIFLVRRRAFSSV
jgi:hypothetical protein